MRDSKQIVSDQIHRVLTKPELYGGLENIETLVLSLIEIWMAEKYPEWPPSKVNFILAREWRMIVHDAYPDARGSATPYLTNLVEIRKLLEKLLIALAEEIPLYVESGLAYVNDENHLVLGTIDLGIVKHSRDLSFVQTCLRCGGRVMGYYTLTKDVDRDAHQKLHDEINLREGWDVMTEAMLPYGRLHLDCVEDLLGRKLTLQDFKDCPGNESILWALRKSEVSN